MFSSFVFKLSAAISLLTDNSIWPVSSPATIVSFTSLALAAAIANRKTASINMIVIFLYLII